MKTLSTGLFVLEQTAENTFKVFRKHYDINLTTEYGEVYLSDEVIDGLEKTPHSGFWDEVVKQCVEKYGQLYEKYGK